MKRIRFCALAMLMILAAVFRPHVVKTTATSSSAVSPRAVRALRPREKLDLSGSYGKLPLSFEANRGQTDGKVRFLSRGAGYSLFLTGDEAVLRLRRPTDDMLASARFHLREGSSVASVRSRSFAGGLPGLLPFGPRNQQSEKRLDTPWAQSTDPVSQHSSFHGARDETSTVLRMRLLGANHSALVAGVEELPGKSNYFVGNDPRKWRANVPTYAKVKYRNIYPGIDLVYHGSQDGQLEYDFVVAPGADPSVIALDVAVDGMYPSRRRGGPKSQLHLGAGGELLVDTIGGEVSLHKPVVYQLVGGRKTDVRGDYELRSEGTTVIRVGAYDRRRPLIIDPVLAYSTYLGGSQQDTGSAIAVDGAGNAYVTGVAGSSDFPVTADAFQTTNHILNGYGVDAFVTKLNSAGSALVYSTFLGGTDDGNLTLALAVDGSGDAYLTGYTDSSDFPTTAGAFQQSMSGACAVFVTKLNPTGNALAYSTFLDGTVSSCSDFGNSIAVDSAGDAYVAGVTSATDFPVTSGAFQRTNNASATGNSNAFVTKLNPSGSALVYSTYLGGSGGDWGSSLALDGSGLAYITGQTYSTDFPVTPGAYQTTNNSGGGFGFVSKMNSTGSALVYSTYLGGDSNEGLIVQSIAIDSSGNAYVAGETKSTNFPVTAGAFQTTNNAAGDTPLTLFITKLNPSGSALIYSTYLGGSVQDNATGLAVDGKGIAYVTGCTQSPDFPVTPDALQSTTVSGETAFLTLLNSTGTALVYSTFLGGSIGSAASGLVLDGSDNAYMTGLTGDSNFPVTSGAYQTTNNANYGINAFVTKFSTTVTGPWASFSAPVLSFSSQTVGATSEPLTETVTSAGTADLTIASVSIGGSNPSDFAISANNCTAAVLAPQRTCAVSVTFTPSAAGTRSAALSFTDNASVSPQSVGLAGTTLTATPNFSPAPGPYASPQTVTIADTTPAATIYYTTNGITPSTSSTQYTGPITVSSSETIEAIATASGYSPSAVATATYTINLNLSPAPTPVLSPAPGNYSSAQSVTISDSVEGATIYYTTDGSSPTTISTQYTGPIMIDSTTTIEAVATASGYAISNVATGLYTISTGVYTTLLVFDETNGWGPNYGPLIQGMDGNFYGATGGSSTGATIYRFTPAGTLTTLYTFPANQWGGNLTGGLVQGTDGYFYGTTNHDGLNSYGTVFRMDSSGNLTILYNFSGPDGINPFAGLALGSDGNIYGTTAVGGVNGWGTVFKITPGGTLTTLYDFAETDGAFPMGVLILASDGNLYGTTSEGGANLCTVEGNSAGCGTIFRMTPDGTLTTLHSFNGADGFTPYAGLLQGTDGNFYGTTSTGGPNAGCTVFALLTSCGTVFKMSPDGTLTTLYDVDDTYGGVPYAGLIQGTDGNLYGTISGGLSGAGSIFSITTAGTFATLHAFGLPDIAGPMAALLQFTNGVFYGTACCGAGGGGGIFSLNVGLGPFVATRPAQGAVGVPVIILGNNLTGATSVSFNGTAAAFTVVSSTEITTMVPAGATTGTVQVVTPGGTLTSNAPFQVAGTVPQAFPPAFSIPGGTYSTAQTVSISDATPGATIYFTTNGTTPTTSSKQYTGPITVSSTETIEAIATASGHSTSAVTTATYTIGSLPVAAASPSSLTFTALMVNSTSSPQAVTLSNTGSAALAVASITAGPNFAQTNNCGSSVAAGSSCTINVTFSPTKGGSLTGAVTITDNSNNTTGSTQTVTLSGTGEDYTLTLASGSSSSASVNPGQSATYTLAVGSEGGLSQSVNFSCTDPASESTCTVSPNPGTPGSNITVTVSTTAGSTLAPRILPPPRLPGSLTVLALALLLASAAWALRAGGQRRRVFVPLAATLLFALALAGCGGGGSSSSGPPPQGTQPGTYNLTVTGTVGSGSTAVSHSMTLTLTVS